jgi:hypothetical protein
MTPLRIRWTFDTAGLQAWLDANQRKDIDPPLVQRLYFEDAYAHWWQHVVLGWPLRSDGTPLVGPDGAALTELSIRVVFVPFSGANATADVARVDVEELRAYAAEGPDGTRFPTRGTIRVDTADVDRMLGDRARFKDTMVHEIGHVLGIGSMFVTGRHVTDEAEPGRAWYIGEHGCRGYAELLGAGGSEKVPLQLLRERKTEAYHWDECALPKDFMSSEIDLSGGGTTNPRCGDPRQVSGINVVSRVSAGALKDLGYVVDLSKALPTEARRDRLKPA